MSSISTLELRGSINRCGRCLDDETYFCWRVAETNKLELLKWAREEKKCKWDEWTINAAAEQGNLEMVKYCVANECPIDDVSVCKCCRKRSSRVPQILTRRSQSALGLVTADWAAEMVIFTYSNILLSVSMINITNWRVEMQPRTATWTV